MDKDSEQQAIAAFGYWFSQYQASGQSTVNDASRIDMQAAFVAGVTYTLRQALLKALR